MGTNKIDGEKKSFKKSWKIQKETFYSHWTKSEPKNQVQFAFRKHWEVFKSLTENKLFNKGNRCLEIGCGRGTMSAYFSDDGYDCTLLDISPDVIVAAKKIFMNNKLLAKFIVGDAEKLPFRDKSFDIVFSLGLLEHFEKPDNVIKEQVRVLNEGGLFIGYVVPSYPNNIQKDYSWINEILRDYKKTSGYSPAKERLYRSDFGSDFYKKILLKLKLKGIGYSGIYPLPMISHSVDFPFSLMPEGAEIAVVKHFKKILEDLKRNNSRNPWLCKEGFGQALLIWGYK